MRQALPHLQERLPVSDARGGSDASAIRSSGMDGNTRTGAGCNDRNDRVAAGGHGVFRHRSRRSRRSHPRAHAVLGSRVRISGVACLRPRSCSFLRSSMYRCSWRNSRSADRWVSSGPRNPRIAVVPGVVVRRRCRADMCAFRRDIGTRVLRFQQCRAPCDRPHAARSNAAHRLAMVRIGRVDSRFSRADVSDCFLSSDSVLAIQAQDYTKEPHCGICRHPCRHRCVRVHPARDRIRLQSRATARARSKGSRHRSRDRRPAAAGSSSTISPAPTSSTSARPTSATTRSVAQTAAAASCPTLPRLVSRSDLPMLHPRCLGAPAPGRTRCR